MNTQQAQQRTAAVAGISSGGSRGSVNATTRSALLGLNRRLKRAALVIDQVLIIAFTLVHIGICLAWINLFLPTFAVYTRDFSYSWFLLALTALHPAAPLAAAYALRRLVSSGIRKWLALLICISFVLIDLFILANALILRFFYCPVSMSPPICTPAASLDALLYFHVVFLVGDFILVALIHKLREDVNIYTFGPLQVRYKTY